jgi:hypothetical protein
MICSYITYHMSIAISLQRNLKLHTHYKVLSNHLDDSTLKPKGPNRLHKKLSNAYT